MIGVISKGERNIQGKTRWVVGGHLTMKIVVQFY